MPTLLPTRQVAVPERENPLVYIVAALVFLVLVCSTVRLQPTVIPEGSGQTEAI